MTLKEDKMSGTFMECLLSPLEGIPTYKYMTNFNVYLNSCSSAVNCTLLCCTLGYLVLTAKPFVFSTHCGTAFLPTINLDIHPVVPDPAPTVLIFSELVRTHKHKFCLFNKYHAVNRAFKKVIRQLIPDK